MLEQLKADAPPICEETDCGGVMRPTGVQRLSYPSQDEYKCPKCGAKRYLRGLLKDPKP